MANKFTSDYEDPYLHVLSQHILTYVHGACATNRYGETVHIPVIEKEWTKNGEELIIRYGDETADIIPVGQVVMVPKRYENESLYFHASTCYDENEKLLEKRPFITKVKTCSCCGVTSDVKQEWENKL